MLYNRLYIDPLLTDSQGMAAWDWGDREIGKETFFSPLSKFRSPEATPFWAFRFPIFAEIKTAF